MKKINNIENKVNMFSSAKHYLLANPTGGIAQIFGVIAMMCLMSMEAIAATAITRAAAWPASWERPLKKTSLQVTANYGALSLGCPNAIKNGGNYEYYLESGRSKHTGTDFAATTEDEAQAIGDGRIIKVGELWGSASHEVFLIEYFDRNGKSLTIAHAHLQLATNPRTIDPAIK
ncbi:hypothetical protein [Nitrosomonas sp. sh817]|uniref:hypothetical protein n=1 Tax=Nitrosomonas sp. sh817 TaxID=3070658 RepID=UPI0027DDF75F|nr:hypothetical protein [Nitrosomonas sp. sh817]WMJ07400.1 hypothetical protein RBH92_08080 [Nitrosomonas sp. sh817]